MDVREYVDELEDGESTRRHAGYEKDECDDEVL
jgi:hypothetical protein